MAVVEPLLSDVAGFQVKVLRVALDEGGARRAFEMK